MCNRNQKDRNTLTENNQPDKIDSILVTYFCGMIDTDVAIKCERLAEIQKQHPNNYAYALPEEFPDELIDDYLEDSSAFDWVKLERVPTELIDTFIVNNDVWNRIAELLEKRTPALDFSEDARMFVTLKNKNGNCDYLCLDSRSNRIKYNNEAYSMDKKLFFLLRYYSGYYAWFGSSDFDWLEELQDTTYYRKALEQETKFNEWW
jgi:hypothetical protein